MNAPTAIQRHRLSRILEVVWPDGRVDRLPCEYLRVFSPSAEVRGHHGGEPQLVGGKREVAITAVEPVGRYAVRLRFDDGHATGLYSWDVLNDLARNQTAWWNRYLDRLQEHDMSRDSAVIKLSALKPRNR
jgi:DUF971 family protein